jgi:hypothetical protein
MESKPESSEEEQEPSIVQERLNWKLAWRDETKVAQEWDAGEESEEMHEWSEAGLLDECCVFLEELGMMRTFEQVRVPAVKRVLVPRVQCVLRYLLNVLFGAASMHELPGVRFGDRGRMELVGFNAQQCEQGLTTRGDAVRTTKKKQGPLSARCLADTISKRTEQEMEQRFHQMVQRLSPQGFFRGKLLVALDGSKQPTPKSDEGCGKRKHTRSGKSKGPKEPATEEYDV